MLHWTSLLFHNWKAKLGSLALATALWLVIRHSIGYPSTAVSVPPPAPSEAAPR